MEHEESRKLKGSFAVPESGKGALLYEPKKLSGSSLPSKDVGIKSTKATKGESHVKLESSRLGGRISYGRLQHGFDNVYEKIKLQREIEERLQALKTIKKIPASLDTTRLSVQEFDMLTLVTPDMFRSEEQLYVVCKMLNIPPGICSCKVSTGVIFYVYNISGRFSRTILGNCLAAVCPADYEIEKIHGILRNGKQVFTSSDNIIGSTSTERCLKESLEKSKMSECSHVHQITSILDGTPLSSLEMEVLAIHISKSWKSLAPMLGVDESKIEKLIRRYSPDTDEVGPGILVYLYNERDDFSREIVMENCKKFGISDVEERLKRVHLVKVSLDNSKTSGSGDLSVSDRTRLSWWEMDKLSRYIRDPWKFAEVLPTAIDQVIDQLPPGCFDREAIQLYAYNESDCFSRKTLGKYVRGGTVDYILRRKSKSMQNVRPISSDVASCKTRTEESSQDKSRSQTTFPLQSTLDSKRLSCLEIEKLSEIMCHGWHQWHEWHDCHDCHAGLYGLAYMLDIPILTVYNYRPFNRFSQSAEFILSLYNESRHFSRKKVKECCKDFDLFEEAIEIVSVEDDSTDHELGELSEKIPALDTTRLSDQEIDMLTLVTSDMFRSYERLYVVGKMLNIPSPIWWRDKRIRAIFYLYNISGRFSRTILGNCLAAVCRSDYGIEKIHRILKIG